MKTKSTRPESKHEWSDGKPRRWLAAAGLAVGALLTCNLMDQATAAGAANVCQKTAVDALTACQAAAQSDYQVALGKCINLTDPTTRKACQRQAAADLADAMQVCQDGFASRQAACQKFGPTPYDPVIDPANFSHVVNNPYFPLVPGTTAIFTEKGGDDLLERRVTVTRDTKVIMGVKCVVVRDLVTIKGEVQEDTNDWYAQDKEGAVWYFGEATKEFKGGGRVSTEGSWEAGVNGQPGIIMPAHPTPGTPYRQEYSPGVAEDMGQVVAVTETVTVPFGSFTGCVRTKEGSMLESGSESKWYAKGIGEVRIESERGEVMSLVAVKKE